MKEISLTQGKVALVDDEDYERLNVFKWHARKANNRFYAIRSDYTNGSQKHIRMHKEIVTTINGTEIDHIDGNGINNQKSNLRVVTRRKNSQNRHCIKTSRFAGVHWDPRVKKWRSQIQICGRGCHLGYFDNELDAHTTYLVAEKELVYEEAIALIRGEK